MRKSSRVTRAVRNGLALSGAAVAVLGLAACQAPSFGQNASGSVVAAAVNPDGSSTSFVDRVADSGPASRAQRAGQPTAAVGPAARSAAATARHTAEAAPADTGSDPAPVPAPSAAAQDPGTPVGGPPPRMGDGMLIGTTDGGYAAAVAGTGVDLANHMYSQFNRPVPTAQMITVGANSTPWRQVAQAGPGSSLYNDIVRWAQTLKSRGPVMVAYDHEPEAGTHNSLGGPADYIAAYQHVETIFNQQGATNIVWTWQMTAFAFSSPPSSDRYAAKWYPGDAWVDNVGADAYNWLGCGGTGSKSNVELQQLGDPVLAFARAHGKTASFPEYGSEANPNRAQWLNNAHQYFVQNRDVMAAAFYFNRVPPEQAHRSCSFALSSASEYGQLRQMAQDTAYVAG